MQVHPIGAHEIDAVTDTVALAFQRDPVWSVALSGFTLATGDVRDYWRHYVQGAHRYGTVFASAEAATVSVWIPPGGTELSESHEAALRGLALAVLGPQGAQALFALWERFAAHHPDVEPHAYLSLLATRPEHAGHGYGQAHLATDLTRWDRSGVATYLESSNPSNNHRYQRQGYTPVGAFPTILDGAVVTTMWRPAAS